MCGDGEVVVVYCVVVVGWSVLCEVVGDDGC